jgi:hypothetical protein
MVEDEDAAGAEPVPQQLLDLGIVDALDLIRVVKVGDCGRCSDQLKSVAVEGELGLAAAGVLDPDLMWIVLAVPARYARGRVGPVARRASGNGALRSASWG